MARPPTPCALPKRETMTLRDQSSTSSVWSSRSCAASAPIRRCWCWSPTPSASPSTRSPPARSPKRQTRGRHRRRGRLGLSRQIARAAAADLPAAGADQANEIDSKMDQGKLLFVVEIPPNFEADVAQAQDRGADQRRRHGGRAGRQRRQLSARPRSPTKYRIHFRLKAAKRLPINLVVRAAFNPNLKTAWFSAMTQVINQITLLTVILTGAALIREREQGTVEHSS